MRSLVPVAAVMILLGLAAPAKAESWTIFRNCSSDPCMIGVARPSWSEPGWHPIATYSGPQGAWAAACALHRQGGTNVSPDIAAGRVDCASLSPDPAALDPIWETTWVIWRSCEVTPCRIGVAVPGDPRPGRDRVRTFASPVAAWRAACDMHFDDPGAFSPDIASGRVDCARLQAPDTLSGEAAALLGQWEFGRVGGVHLCEVELTAEDGAFGKVLRACHPDESFWRLIGGDLHVFRDDGVVSTIFTRVRRGDWTGDYLVDRSTGYVHYLRHDRASAAPLSEAETALLGPWRFGREDGAFLCDVVLTAETGEHGKVIRACHPNESFRKLVGEELHVFRDDGVVSTIFRRVSADRWSGSYLIDRSTGYVHYLERDGAGEGR